MIEILRQMYGRHEWKPPRYQIAVPGFRVVLPDVLSINVGDDMEGVALEFAPAVAVHKELNWVLDWMVGKWASRNVGTVVLRVAGGIVVKDENGVVLLKVGA